VEAVADIKRTSEDGFFMNQSTKETDGKRLYAPPRLTTISLRPEEAVLGACKSLNTGGSMGGSCLIPMGGCITSNAGS
jgi:hypothetical protein